jgi:hypothetical protein
MASRRRSTKPQTPPSTSASGEVTQPEPTGKIFLGEEDKRLLKKFNQHIVNKLGLGGNRSVKL